MFSLLYTIIFLTVCINFDQEIMRLAETCGFISSTSRPYKFYIFFFALGLFVFAAMINEGLGDGWSNNINYVQNALAKMSSTCTGKNFETEGRIWDLGNAESFKDCIVIFYWVGVAFGCPYSMTQINVVDWIYSKWYLKLIRTVIACAISTLIMYAFNLM